MGNEKKKTINETKESIKTEQTSYKSEGGNGLNKQQNKVKPVAIGDGVLIKVKSAFFGKLYYYNKTSGERYVWEHVGEVQIMPMRELRTMKAQQVAFFKNQWVMIEGIADGEDCNATVEDIYKSLIITQYYKDFIEPDDFSMVCRLSADEIKEKVSYMSTATKENLIVALSTFIQNGELDSIKKIKAFEEALGCVLIDYK